jgi:hypothetical protein
LLPTPGNLFFYKKEIFVNIGKGFVQFNPKKMPNFDEFEGEKLLVVSQKI